MKGIFKKPSVIVVVIAVVLVSVFLVYNKSWRYSRLNELPVSPMIGTHPSGSRTTRMFKGNFVSVPLNISGDNIIVWSFVDSDNAFFFIVESWGKYYPTVNDEARNYFDDALSALEIAPSALSEERIVVTNCVVEARYKKFGILRPVMSESANFGALGIEVSAYGLLQITSVHKASWWE